MCGCRRTDDADSDASSNDSIDTDASDTSCNSNAPAGATLDANTSATSSCVYSYTDVSADAF